MNKRVKFIPAVLSTMMFATACDSAPSEAQKIDVNSAAPKVEKVVEKVVEKATEAPAKQQAANKATDSSGFIEGVHYVDIFPEMQTNAAAGKVEVIELMWLGCPHCYDLEPVMKAYQKNLPDYVEFEQVPAMLNPSWSADANTFFIAEILDPKGEKDLIARVFSAIHEQKRRIRSPEAAKRFFVQLGYSEEDVDKAKASMLFRIKVKRAQEVSTASQAQSVPTVIINGRYRTSPYMAGTNAKLMEIIDMLTRKEKNK